MAHVTISVAGTDTDTDTGHSLRQRIIDFVDHLRGDGHTADVRHPAADAPATSEPDAGTTASTDASNAAPSAASTAADFLF